MRLPRIAVAVGADEPFAIGLAALGRSVYDNRPRGYGVDLFVLDFGITASSRTRLTQSFDLPGLDLHWIDGRTTDLLDQIPIESPCSVAAGSPYVIGQVLPTSVERVLLLDADVVVDHDLGPLWESDLGEFPLAAVRDTMIPFWRNNGFMPADSDSDGATPNFNSGVLLINLPRWRDEEIGTRAARFSMRYGDRFWSCDQQALGCAVGREWLELPLYWNRMTHLSWIPSARCLPFGADEVERTRRRPHIIHFAGESKPWHATYRGDLGEVFYSYLDRTAWEGWRPPGLPLSRKLKLAVYRAPRERFRLVRRGLRLCAEEGLPSWPWWISAIGIVGRYPASLVGFTVVHGKKLAERLHRRLTRATS